ncbi:MAG: hypothetical protein MHPSP_004232, partial [Paramarteilia canceri]
DKTLPPDTDDSVTVQEKTSEGTEEEKVDNLKSSGLKTTINDPDTDIENVLYLIESVPLTNNFIGIILLAFFAYLIVPIAEFCLPKLTKMNNGVALVILKIIFNFNTLDHTI